MSRKIALATAVVALTAPMASAQTVVDDLTELAALYGGAFTNIAVNTAEIQGGIDISAGGQNGGTDDESFTAGFDGLGVSVVGGGSLNVAGFEWDEVDEATTFATTTSFGALSTLAAGAVNETITVLTENPAVIGSGSDTAAVGLTNASAEFDQSFGSGTFVLSGAYNDADIFGDVTVEVAAGNSDFGSISTTAAGAINTGNITATFVGSDEPAQLQ